MATTSMCPGRDSNPSGGKGTKKGREAAERIPHRRCPLCDVIRRECSKCELKRLRAERKHVDRLVAKLSKASSPDVRAVASQFKSALAQLAA